MEVLNQEKVYFFLNSDKVLHVSCKEPVEIINHETGYRIRYMLQRFQYDYRSDEYFLRGSASYEEFIPQDSLQKRNWEKKRQDVYAVSLTHFIRALYGGQIHEEGFRLTTMDALQNTSIDFPLADILQPSQNRIQVNLESSLLLTCFSKPVTDKMIQNRYAALKVPVVKLFPQQLTIYPDGTYSGTLHVHAVRYDITGLSAMLPLEYGY